MYYPSEVLNQIKKILDEDGKGEYNIYIAKTLNNELKEIIIVPYKKEKI